MNGLSLFSGIGGLDLACRLAIPGYRTVAYVEKEEYPRRVLAARMRDGCLHRGPIYGDIRDFPAEEWRGKIDIIHGGIPCQPWSVAGKRKGAEDSRFLWPEVARIVRTVLPGYVFVENVPGFRKGGIEAVLGDLAALGFNAEWESVRASDVGATHRRERLFILAHCNDNRHQSSPRPESVSGSTTEKTPGAKSGGDGRNVGDPQEPGLEGADAEGISRPDGRPAEPGLPLWPPGPEDWDDWERVIATDPDLAPAVECGFRRLANGRTIRVVPPYTNVRLKALGNMVVPAQGALAIRMLWGRLMGAEACKP